MKKPFTENKILIIKDTRNGKGIFTKKLFEGDEVIFPVTGPLITGDVDEEIDDTTRSNAIRYDGNFYISPDGGIADFLNHSCNPNAKVVKKGDRLSVVAIHCIPAHREVLIDYSTITAADDIWTMRCNCGSLKCRGIIKRFKKLPTAMQETYIRREIVPAYILAIS